MKKKYNIEVDCANCAAKMEATAAQVEGVAAITVNFMTQKMTVEFEDGADEYDVMEKVTAVCKRIERGFTIEM